MGERLQGSEAASSHFTLSMSRSEAGAVARWQPDGWFIATCGEQFIVGRFTAKGRQHVITFRDEPVAFDDFPLAEAYLRELGVEWPLYLQSVTG
jgi:hypothetical protein